jgi:hypothetical protein
MTEVAAEFESMSPRDVLEFMREKSDSYHLCRFALYALGEKIRGDRTILPEEESDIQAIWSEATELLVQARVLNTGQ